MSKNETYCGFVAIVGRPNVGKSSLLNALIKQKISIISFRPQTTRHQVLGIKTKENKQIVYVDTPGIHLGEKKALNRQMNKVAYQALIDVNAVIFVLEALKWTEEDSYVAQLLKKLSCPVIVVPNKIDLVTPKEKLLAWINEISTQFCATEIVPISVKKHLQLDYLDKLIENYLPPSPFYFPLDQVHNHQEPFQISETIREKMLYLLNQELPYSTCVQIEKLTHEERLIRIEALIWVEREGQKKIVVGEKGHMLREIGTRARLELEQFYHKKVFLKLWVKVKSKWSENMRTLLEYSDH